MTNARTMAAVAALTVAALALTTGAAGAASPHGRDKGAKPSVSGTVTSVNGSTTPGACGTSDNSGVYLLSTTEGNPPTQVVTTVTVTPTTAFVEHKVATPSFADVCVGDKTAVVGSDVDFSMTALAVAIKIPKPTHVYGLITSVNGTTAQGSCGTAGADGIFTLVTIVDSTPTDSTVYVDGGTTFVQKKVSDASFADVCVGDQADAIGPVTDGVVVADLVTVRVPRAIKLKGAVISVNGDSTSGVCGVADSGGGFTIQSTHHGVSLTYSIAVTTSTGYAEAGVTTATFADVCVGNRVEAIGATSGGVLTADAVAIYPPKA
jgi:hypothetical protein